MTTISRHVSGEILLGRDMDSFRAATLRVFIEDVTYVGESSQVVAELLIEGVVHQGEEEGRVPFRLSTAQVDQHKSYNVRAYIDIDGDGEVSRGDYVTVQSYPVLTRGHPDNVVITVHKVV